MVPAEPAGGVQMQQAIRHVVLLCSVIAGIARSGIQVHAWRLPRSYSATRTRGAGTTMPELCGCPLAMVVAEVAGQQVAVHAVNLVKVQASGIRQEQGCQNEPRQARAGRGIEGRSLGDLRSRRNMRKGVPPLLSEEGD